MSEEDDPLKLMDTLSGPKRRPKVGDFDDPVRDTVDRKKAAKATGRRDSAVAGQYIRYGFTWSPGQLAKIEEVATELNLSKNAAARWLMDRGLTAYLAGDRPEVVEKQVRVEVKLEEW